MPQKSAFVIGERTERELAMLIDALVRHGVKSAAVVVDTAEDESAVRAAESRAGLALLPPVRCDVPLAEAGKPRFPADAWISSGVVGWLVSGPTSCSRDVMRDVRHVLESHGGGDRTFALTLEAGVPLAEVPRGVTVLSASAGLVPVLATHAEDVHDDDVKRFMESFAVRPSYWTAIGRDGGVLARAALQPLPADTTTDTKSVIERRAIVEAGLFAARARLWTTDDRGVGSDRVLPRALRLVTWRGDK